MRGAQGEFGAPGPTLLKTGGEIFNSGTGTRTCWGREAELLGIDLADRWRREGDRGWGWGRWRDGHPRRLPGKPGEERSCRQHGDREREATFNWSSGRPAVPSLAPGGVARVEGVGCHSCSITPPGLTATPVPAGAPGAPPRGCQLLEAARMERRCPGWGARV